MGKNKAMSTSMTATVKQKDSNSISSFFTAHDLLTTDSKCTAERTREVCTLMDVACSSSLIDHVDSLQEPLSASPNLSILFNASAVLSSPIPDPAANPCVVFDSQSISHVLSSATTGEPTVIPSSVANHTCVNRRIRKFGAPTPPLLPSRTRSGAAKLRKKNNAQNKKGTEVALHALSAYGAATYVKKGKSSVTVSYGTKVENQYHVDDGNRHLLQRAKLPHVPGEYKVEVQGNGCVYTQSTLQYYVPRPTGDAPFDLNVWTVPDVCDQKSEKSFEVHVNVSYTGKRPSSNMAIVDVKLPSGFIPVKSTVKRLNNWSGIGQTEVHPNKATIYLGHVSNATTSFWFSVEQAFEVRHRKRVMVKVTDYYETDEFAVDDYSAPCSTEHAKKTHR